MVYSPFIDILHKKSKEPDGEQAFLIQGLEGNSQRHLVDYVKNNEIEDLMSFNVLYGMSLVDFILRD